MTSSLGHKQFVFSAWIPPGALNAIFSGVPIFLEAFAPLSIELQRGNPSTGANVRDVNSVRRCVVCTSAPGLFWKPSPPLLLLALILFPGPWFFIFFFLQPPEAQHIWPSGQQATKQWWTATMCREFLQSPPPLPPSISLLLNVCSFILHWRIVLSPWDVAGFSAGMSAAAHCPPPGDAAMGQVA